MRRLGRAGLVVAGAAGLVVTVAGCRGGAAPADPPAGAAMETTAAEATGRAGTAAGNAGAREAEPVPDVKTLFDSPAPGAPKRPAVEPGETTAPGTRLRVGESALIRYDGSSAGATVVEVTVESVEAGRIADLAEFNLPADAAASTPYYVTLRWTNRGETTLKYPGLVVPTTAHTASGEASPITLIGSFPRCDTVDASPAEFAPEISVSGCRVFLVPAGQKVAQVGWSGSFRDDPVLWAAG
jgi:hypothetical protein